MSEPRGPYWLNFGGHVVGGPETATGRFLEATGRGGGGAAGRARRARRWAGGCSRADGSRPIRCDCGSRRPTGSRSSGPGPGCAWRWRSTGASRAFGRASRSPIAAPACWRSATTPRSRSFLGRCARPSTPSFGPRSGARRASRRRCRPATGSATSSSCGIEPVASPGRWSADRAAFPRRSSRSWAAGSSPGGGCRPVTPGPDGVVVGSRRAGASGRSTPAPRSSPPRRRHTPDRARPPGRGRAGARRRRLRPVRGRRVPHRRDGADAVRRRVRRGDPGLSFNMLFNRRTWCAATGASGRRHPDGLRGRGARPRLAGLDDSEIERRFLNDLHGLFPDLRGHVRETVIRRWEPAFRTPVRAGTCSSRRWRSRSAPSTSRATTSARPTSRPRSRRGRQRRAGSAPRSPVRRAESVEQPVRHRARRPAKLVERAPAGEVRLAVVLTDDHLVQVGDPFAGERDVVEDEVELSAVAGRSTRRCPRRRRGSRPARRLADLLLELPRDRLGASLAELDAAGERDAHHLPGRRVVILSETSRRSPSRITAAATGRIACAGPSVVGSVLTVSNPGAGGPRA